MKETLRERCRSTFSSRLFELANIPFQKECWLAKIPNSQSSFRDILEVFEHFINENVALEYVTDQVLDNDEAYSIIKLTKMLNQLDDYISETDFEILWEKDEWIEITKLARDIYYKSFENDEKDYYEKYSPEDFVKFNDLIRRFPLK